MPNRKPIVAGSFYPASEAACRRELAGYLGSAVLPLALGRICAAVVPHAGWVYSGPTAAHAYAALGRQEAPETVVLFGAVHHWGVTQPSVYGQGSWQTPLGVAEIDEQLASAVLAAGAGLLVARASAHDGEHSIEVQLPFVQYLFPAARVLPIAVPPLAASLAVGESVARAAQESGRHVVAVGSSDLTHYGPNYGLAPAGVGLAGLEWSKRNDERLLRLAAAMRACEVLAEAEAHHNACGAGAIAATLSFAATLGATAGVLLQHTTSYEVRPSGRQPSDLVGYAAMVYPLDDSSS